MIPVLDEITPNDQLEQEFADVFRKAGYKAKPAEDDEWAILVEAHEHVWRLSIDHEYPVRPTQPA